MNRKMTQTSTRLSWLLRHGAAETGIAMDGAGWVAVSDVLDELHISLATLEESVRSNSKRRLEHDGDRVRACQGHSTAGTPVTAEALEASWRPYAGDASIWHGTSLDVVAKIAAEGIWPQARTHVHLAPALESTVGKRAAVHVMLEVSAARLREAGIGVFEASNGVVLVRSVPPACIVGVRAITRRARAQAPELAALFEVLESAFSVG